jgi:hypothetical protein
MTTGSPSPRSIRDWYRLSKKDSSKFFNDLHLLDCSSLIAILQQDIALQPRGRLRTAAELESLSRTGLPSLDVCKAKGPDEQTLQWMFMHRRYFELAHERIVWRELPTCCAEETPEGWCDLLAFDEAQARPLLVELKRGSATDPLTGVLLEALWHWVFGVRHNADLNTQLRGFGHTPNNPPRLAVAAPDEYYRQAQQRTREPRGSEYQVAIAWLACLRQNKIVDIDLYAIEDAWLSTGPAFNMRKI